MRSWIDCAISACVGGTREEEDIRKKLRDK